MPETSLLLEPRPNRTYPPLISLRGEFNGVGMFISAFRHSTYSGQIYLINPKYAGKLKEIKGYPLYASVSDVPEKELDYVICSIKAKYVADLIKECLTKNVKFVTIFSSGFSELLRDDSRKMEQELQELIKGTQTRLIGPNCLGALCPKSGITFNPVASSIEGNIAFVSQSGGVATTLCEIQRKRSLYYSKGLSFGNQIDLSCLDLLRYYGQDSDTDVIGMYLEDLGQADGGEFIQEIRKITKQKPVVIWKGGQTAAGARATASHTGAMAGSLKLWKVAISQAGGRLVLTSQEFWDLLHLFSCIIPNNRLPRGKRVAIIVPGGGASVEITDTFSRFGFDVPILQPEIQDKLKEIFPPVNTGFRNPVDTGAVGFIIDTVIKSIRYIDKDPNIDSIIYFTPINWLTQLERQGVEGHTLSVARSLGRMNKKLTKLFLIICPIFEMTEFNAKMSIKFKEAITKKYIPHFETIEGAVRALNGAYHYFSKHQQT
ncbi:MAG: CoA-binding protein [Candidatus Helarchaeota archaeon]